jgi:von Willebrand factor type A domain
MRRPTAALGLLLALVGLLAAPAGTAAAQERNDGDVAAKDITVRDGHLRFLVTGLDPRSGSSGLSGPVELRVDGYAVAADATVPEREPGPRTTILVVDTSGSMDGALLDQAKRAIGSFLDAAPEADRVGLVAFADRPLLLAPPIAPRSDVRDEVAELTAGGSTSLYDAVDVALTLFGTAGDHRVVVLSEGPDTASSLDLPGLLARVRAGRSRVDLVRLAPAGSGAADPQAAIAEAGGGQVFHADDAEGAARVLRDRALQGSSEVAVDAALPPGLSAGTVRLQLALPWGDRTVDVDTTAPLAADTGPVGEVVEDPGVSWPWLVLGLAGVFAALSLVVVAMVAVPESVHGRRRMQKLVAHYATVGLRAAPSDRTAGERRQDGSLREGALKLADRVAARRGIGERLALRLE